ncbi:hypothetical protein G6678_05655 [Polynucleobacter paneuropaeus]|jgi:hypothetical protein|nr:hypothetical protein G6703_05605 [Polynucleobacter paneuropaeus]QWD32940.1 hypothetical protein G6678_05655 [Polynucleobacter paneuropaeus]
MGTLTESQLLEKLCKTFNTRFSGSRNAMLSLSEALEMSDMLHPGLRNIKGKEFLSLFQDRMNVWHPEELRVLVVDILIHVMKEKVTTDSSKQALQQEIDGYLLPINFW